MTGGLVSPALRTRVRALGTPVAVALGRLGLSPNALTVIGLGIAAVAGLAAASGAWLAAGLLTIFGGAFDLLDGALARATGRANALGAFLDSTLDRGGEALVYLGIAWGGLAAGDRLLAFLAPAAMAAASMVSYTRAKAESLGFSPGTGMASVGFAPREVRIVILSGALVVAGLGSSAVLTAALAIITFLATVTAVQRTVHVIRRADDARRSD